MMMVYCELGQRHGSLPRSVHVSHVPSYVGFRRWRCQHCGEALPPRCLLREMLALVLRM